MQSTSNYHQPLFSVDSVSWGNRIQSIHGQIVQSPEQNENGHLNDHENL